MRSQTGAVGVQSTTAGDPGLAQRIPATGAEGVARSGRALRTSPARSPRPSSSPSRPRRGARPHGWLFSLPALVLVATFGLLPILVALVVSVTDLDIGGLAHPGTVQFIGAHNYVRLLADPDFLAACVLTAAYVLVGVPLITVLSLAVATGLNRSDGWFFRFLRTMYFLPAVTALVAISVIWKYLYNGQYGVLNWALSSIGLPELAWLSDPTTARIAVGVVAVWRAIGFNAIILLAAIQGVPPEHLEAASLDGAGPVRRYVYVVLPQIRFAVGFVVMTTMIAWLQFFDEPFVLTDGGPVGATTSVSIFLFKQGFRLNEFGYASAGSVVLLCSIALITLLQLRMRRADA